MKTKMNRILAILISAILLVGIIPTQSFAETTVALTPDGTAGNANVVYVTLGGLSTNQKYCPVDGYVKLNGETLNNEYELDYAFNYAGWGNVHYIQLTHIDTSKDLTFAEGSILTVGGTFEGQTDGSVINIEEVHLKCTSPTAAWEVYVPTTSVTLTPSDVAGNADVVYVSLGGLSTNQKYSPVDGYVKLNGETLANEYELDYTFTYAGWGDAHYIKLTHVDTSKALTFAEGSILTIGGTFEGQTDGSVINIEEVHLKCTSPTAVWEVYVPATSVTLTPSDVAGNADVVYVSLSGLSTNQKYSPVDGYVKLNGETLANEYELDYTFTYAGWGDAHYIKLTHVDTNKDLTFAEGSILTIGGTFEGQTDGSVINIEEVQLKCTSPTAVWEVYVPATSVTLTPDGTAGKEDVIYVVLSGLTTNQKYTVVDGYVKLNDTELVNADELDYVLSYAGWGSVHYIKLTDYAGKGLKFAEGSTLTVGGTFQGADGTLIDIIETKLECNSSFGWSVYVEPIQLAKPVITIIDSTVSWTAVENATNYEIYLDGVKKGETTGTTYDLSTLNLGAGTYSITVKVTGGDKTIAATSDAAEYVIVAPTSVTMTIDGTPGDEKVIYVVLSDLTTNQKYTVVDGYVKLNDTELVNADELDYVLSYAGWGSVHYIKITDYASKGLKFENGSVLTVGGTFQGTDGALINITPVIWEYDGSTWSEYEPNVTIPGDFDGNDEINVVDLIKFKKNATDLNVDSSIDKEDAVYMRYLVLGCQHIDGVWTAKYNSRNTINIFADCPPIQYVKADVKNYFDAGFTTLVMTDDYMLNENKDGNQRITTADGEIDTDYANAIKYALKYGDVMVRNTEDNPNFFTNNTGSLIESSAGDHLDIEAGRDIYLKLYELGVRQFYIMDEPAMEKLSGWFGGADPGEIPDVVTMAQDFAGKLPSDALFHVNLLPSYGEGGNVFTGETISHSEYVEQYANDVLSQLPNHRKTLSVDNYPLLASGIRTSYLTDLWMVANKAKTVGNTTINYCIQAYAEEDTTVRTPSSKADISFQTNTGLVLGARSFEYFKYDAWVNDADYHDDSCIIGLGLYDEVQSVNQELLAWDQVYMSFDWQGVKTYNVSSSMKADVTEMDLPTGVTATADQATLVGIYTYSENKSEYGYMVTNFTDPSANTTDNVTLTLSAGQKVLVYQNGKGTWMNADASGNLSLSLPAGGGAFVIPQ